MSNITICKPKHTFSLQIVTDAHKEIFLIVNYMD